MYLLLLAIIYLAFISLGLPDSLLGAAWPTMRGVLGVPISYMGIISMIICLGTICSSLISERVTKKFTTKYVTVVSVFLTAIALFGFSTSTNFVVLCLWAIPYGIGAGAIDAALNNYVAIHYNSRHMSWLHCFWGVGTIISPYIMSYALTHYSWNMGYRMVSCIQFIIVVILILTLAVWNINKIETNIVDKSDNEILGIKGALKIKGVIYILIGFMAYCAAENTTMLWASSYLVEVKGLEKERAAALGALFFIGITVGRFIAGFISEKLGDKKMIEVGTIIVLVGICCVLMSDRLEILIIIGLVLIGLGCAPIYPSIIHSTPENFGANNSRAIIGIQMASAYVGATFMPPLFGIIAQHINIRIFPIYILLFIVLMYVMVMRTFKLAKKG